MKKVRISRRIVACVLALACMLACSIVASAAAPDTTPPGKIDRVFVTAYPSMEYPKSFFYNWTAATDDVGVAGYKATLTYVATGESVTYDTAGTQLPTYFLASSSPDEVKLTVYAYDAAGNIGPSTTEHFLGMEIIDDTPPSAIERIFVSAYPSMEYPKTFFYNWTAATDNVGVTGYHATLYDVATGVTEEYDTTNTQLPKSFIASSSNDEVILTVYAYDAAGNHGPSISKRLVGMQEVDKTPPSPVYNIYTIAYPEEEFAKSYYFAWTPATDNVGVVRYDVAIFNVQMGTTRYFTTSDTRLPDMMFLVNDNTEVQIVVIARDAAGNGSPATSMRFIGRTRVG